ncbi:hypothetical protein PFISCL1PPCAC_3135, partial [Pristionchus fissidentatus]
LQMQWSVTMEGGPRRVNHAAVLLGDNHIYSFGGYCSLEQAKANAPIDIHVLNASTYKWQRVWSWQEQKMMATPPRGQRRSRREMLNEAVRNRGDSAFDDDEEEEEKEDERADDEVMMVSDLEDDDSDMEYQDARRDPVGESEDEAEAEEEREENGNGRVEDNDESDAESELDLDFFPFNHFHIEGIENEHINQDSRRLIPFYRYGHTVVAHRGKAYLWGGRNDEVGASDIVHVFDPVSNKWTSLATKGRTPPARDGHSAVVYNDQMIIFGGFEEADQRFSQETYVFDFATAKWEEMATMGERPRWRDFHTSVVMGEEMYVFGGRCDIMGQYHSTRDVYDEDMWALNLHTRKWRRLETKGEIPSGRRSHSAFCYDGKMYVIGGFNGTVNAHYNDLHSFDPKTEIWSLVRTLGESPSERRRQCTVVANNQLFLFGGTKPSGIKTMADHQLSLTDLSDLHVLDLKPTLYQMAAKVICTTKRGRDLLRTRMMYLPRVLREDMLNRIDPFLWGDKPVVPLVYLPTRNANA